MAMKQRRVLVVGSPAALTDTLARLTERDFRFDFVTNTRAASNYLADHTAELVLLDLPSDEIHSREALAWLRSVREELPVVVVSSEADMGPYLTAMESGAFDYLTSHTPAPEVERVLASAIRHYQRQAA